MPPRKPSAPSWASDNRHDPCPNPAALRALPWQGDITAEPLLGGLSNESWKVTDARGPHVVRFGRDFPFHHVDRTREVMTARAAHAAGFGPAVEYAAPGVIVVEYLQRPHLGRRRSARQSRTRGRSAAPLPSPDARACVGRGLPVLALPRDPRLCPHPARGRQPVYARPARASGPVGRTGNRTDPPAPDLWPP